MTTATGSPHLPYLFTHPDGETIEFWTPFDSNRFLFDGRLPNDPHDARVDRDSHDLRFESISVADTRTASAMAREITRRLLPPYRKALVQYQLRLALQRQANMQIAEAAEQIADAIGTTPSQPQITPNGPRSVRFNGTARPAPGSRTHPFHAFARATIDANEYHGTALVDLEARELTPRQAAAALQAIAAADQPAQTIPAPRPAAEN
ncbi:hypothetical protein BIV57_13325 [Mangrovactinospora gilvigrisea]|uniref:Uncharacterized protein n=1 Tax=Mangrovactinospora gilvigrisea TaxID=1428644 RepID=A0A1J7BU46_9ACTN|nr:hypothetical protein [Mangrovactinospora gilvigrisea]OIV36969.1 hypothetical protein BIV57_13325 [Mangrovactinospora gilvigrisea]